MRKLKFFRYILLSGVSLFAFTGCTTILQARNGAVKSICQNETVVVDSLYATGDIATAEAIKTLCAVEREKHSLRGF